MPTPAATGVPAAPAPPSSWAAGAAALYVTAPDVAGCRAGALADAVRADVLARLNAIRALHRLPAVTYNDADEAQAMEASLMMAANGALDHRPPATWRCWTQAGYDGAASSNLYGGTVSRYLVWSSEDAYLAGWLTETSNIVADSVGHRRWLLDPFLSKISYGRVAQVLAGGERTDAAALKVFAFTGGTTVPSNLPPFVAYPYGDYPARYFDKAANLSFSVVASGAGRSANAAVSFAGATVTVRDAAGTALTVSAVRHDNDGYGVPNNLQWKVAGLADGAAYTVTIAGVTVNGATRSYDYGFRTVP